ncbi:MAG: DUF4476 domain-containing protein [Bacteroidales bacterium]|nr:DUF4476 domain-containing protein [Bacteroidales bacterium]
MKRIFLAVFLSIAGLVVLAQNQQQLPAEKMPDRVYNQYFDQFSMQKTDAMRMQNGRTWMGRYSLTSYQVKKLAQLFYSDEERLAFAMAVYPNVRDKENFYDVYDVFAFFSTVFRLHDFVNGMQMAVPINQVPVMNFPPYMYPVWEGYTGPRGCQMPVSAEDFNFLAFQVQQQNDENSRLNLAIDISRNNCLSVAHIMKLSSLIPMEQIRLNYLKAVSQFAFDQRNLEGAAQVLRQEILSNEFISFVRHNMPGVGFDPMPPINPCMINDADFREMKSMIDKQSFNNTRLSMARQSIGARKCFTSHQILEIVKLMQYESSKMELAKFAYDYCLDREKYYVVTEAFSFESSKQDLLKFIGGE